MPIEKWIIEPNYKHLGKRAYFRTEKRFQYVARCVFSIKTEILGYNDINAAPHPAVWCSRAVS